MFGGAYVAVIKSHSFNSQKIKSDGRVVEKCGSTHWVTKLKSRSPSSCG